MKREPCVVDCAKCGEKRIAGWMPDGLCVYCTPVDEDASERWLTRLTARQLREDHADEMSDLSWLVLMRRCG